MQHQCNEKPPRVEDLTGQRFGRLIVQGYSHREKRRDRNQYQHYWICQCDCGNETIVQAVALKNSAHPTRSCGCLLTEILQARGTHRQQPKSLYQCWRNMKNRCTNPNIGRSWKDYGGRGITFCEQWDKFEGFRSWALTSGWETGKQIDRIDVNGNYEPKNCRWVTRREQMQNVRTNHVVVIGKEKGCLIYWAAKLGLSIGAITSRLGRGWSEHDAVTTPRQRGSNAVLIR